MQTKTYFASSVPAALELARQELGDEAMLVRSRPAQPSARSLGKLEVTFAYDPRQIAAPLPAAPARSAITRLTFPTVSRTASPPVVPAPPPAAPKPASGEMEEIRQQIRALKRAVSGAPASGASVSSDSANELFRCGFGADLADEIAASAARSGRPDGLARELTARISTASFEPANPAAPRTIAFLGPPGRGKTTTLVKIAVRFGLAKRIPVKIYLAGAHGVGCEDQMARYAAVLGVPFQSCESIETLSMALNGDMWKGLALIDTPGISPSDTEEIAELGRFFRRRTEIERHLVLRADARSADIAHMIARFGPLEASRLLFTGLDEAVSLGPMMDGLVRSRIPAALAGTGPRIPEDLEPVNATWLVETFRRESARNEGLPGGLSSAAAAA